MSFEKRLTGGSSSLPVSRSLSWYGAPVVEAETILPVSAKASSTRYFLPSLRDVNAESAVSFECLQGAQRPGS